MLGNIQVKELHKLYISLCLTAYVHHTRHLAEPSEAIEEVQPSEAIDEGQPSETIDEVQPSETIDEVHAIH